MDSQTIDAGAFRDRQRDQWNTAATGWRKWNEWLDRATAGINQRLVELAGVEPGSRVLDVATGYGEPALTAARVATAIAPGSTPPATTARFPLTVSASTNAR